MRTVTVILLNWNGKKFLQDFLPSVVANSNYRDTEIIIADNHSDDGSVEFLTQTYPGIRLIRFDKNLGFAGGYQKALEQIQSRYFVLLNTDVKVTENWLRPLIDTMENDNSIGACMPKIKSSDRPDCFEYAGASGGFIDTFGYPFCRGRILGTIERDTGQYDDSRRVFWASGACLAVRSSSYFKAGGLDDLFFAHMEEIDLCWRLQNLGQFVYCLPRSVVYHVGGGSLPNNNPRKIYLNYRNNLYLLFKNLSSGRLLPVIFTRMLMDVVSAFVYLFQGSVSFSFAVVKAHFDFYCHIPVLVRKRKLIGSKAGTAKLPGIYHGSIVFDYFFRKKRFFSQLDFDSNH